MPEHTITSTIEITLVFGRIFVDPSDDLKSLPLCCYREFRATHKGDRRTLQQLPWSSASIPSIPCTRASTISAVAAIIASGVAATAVAARGGCHSPNNSPWRSGKAVLRRPGRPSAGPGRGCRYPFGSCRSCLVIRQSEGEAVQLCHHQGRLQICRHSSVIRRLDGLTAGSRWSK